MRSVRSLPELEFAQSRFLGNIGAPLDMDQWSRERQYEEDYVEELTEAADGIGVGDLEQLAGDETTTVVPVVRQFQAL